MLKNNIDIEGKNILVTGAAGFIGSSLIKKIFSQTSNTNIIGLDSLNDYYDVSLKEYRISEIEKLNKNWIFIKGTITDRSFVDKVFRDYKPDVVINLAAQAGVRYSITHPDAYIESNIIGFYNILETCRKHKIEHLIFASSSSVYGNNTKTPYSTDDKTDCPVSLYAATKKTNELLAYSYAKLYDMPATGIRFFTVYGPAGRPDMAYFKFTNDILAQRKIQIYNYGKCERDFTYIDDATEAILRIIQHAPEKKNTKDGETLPPYKIYNVGNSHPENLDNFVTILITELIKNNLISEKQDYSQLKEYLPMQPGDVPITYADTSLLENDLGFHPHTPLSEGLHKFVQWYKEYYKTQKQK